ncbi:MAG: zf-HC2 domain-containing protein, partial [Armatimonadetes bacterium]|nr:zf-HC2 domain-containing protein [Armatimonadota bacterium]
AKRRVNAALKMLRTALTDEREERAAMKCTDITDRRLLDYVYGKLPVAEENMVREHLAGCSICGERVEEIGKVLRALDAVENDWKITSITELDEQGVPTSYISMSMPNLFDEPTQEIELGSPSRSGLSFVSVWGEEAPFEIVPSEHEEESRKFRVHLPRPASPLERFDLLMVVDDDRPMTGEGPVVPLGDGRWRLGPGKLHTTEALVYVVAVRLPGGARLVEATPGPSEVRSNDRTTVVWRNTLPPDQRFEFWIEYQLRQKE